MGATAAPQPSSSLVCVFCNGELRVETLAKYDVFLIMCEGCGNEMIDCDCMNMRVGPRLPEEDRSHHRR